MFTSIFGKRRSSPVEDSDTPPIPGARADDMGGYVMIEPAPNPGSMYPSITPIRAAPAVPPRLPHQSSADSSFHYMQGVPFSLSRELQMASNKESFAIEIGDLLAFVSNKINLHTYEYDFSVEKSVLKEC